MARKRNSPLTDSENGRKLIRLFEVVAASLAAALLAPDAPDNLPEVKAQSEEDLDALLVQARGFAQTEITNRYAQGLTEASAILAAAGIALGEPNRAAHNTVAQSMATELVDDFAKGIIAVQDGVNSAVSQAQREKILSRFGKGLRKEQEEKIRNILMEQGTKGLLDRGGKRWDITTYAKMLVRTKEREALNAGMITRAQEVGISVFRINFTGSKHEECIVWQNKHVSVSGEFGLPTIDEATASGIFHPNCRHRLFPDPEEQRRLEAQQ